MIGEDPMLADTKIIAEAWDAAGAFQVGSFGELRWAEWNGHYRDDVRRYWRGDAGLLGPLATRVAGSSDLYECSGRHPYNSINFVTSHDGFPLNDLVSYEDKHNEGNGEGNRDGDNNNHSKNYGVEGTTRRKDVQDVRLRQIKNMLATLMLSQGVPMLLSGDECRRTQRGNNNAYCQDNPVSWFNWKLVEKNVDLVRFTQALIKFRRKQPTVRSKRFLRGISSDGKPAELLWFSAVGTAVNWEDDQALVCLLTTPDDQDDPHGDGRDVLLMFNATNAPRDFILPQSARDKGWGLLVDTAESSPRDIFPNANGPAPPLTGRVNLSPRSLRCYVGR